MSTSISEKVVLAFFNRVTNEEEIVNSISDDPRFGTDSNRAFGIRSSLAKKILRKRNQLSDKKFTLIQQIQDINGLGDDTMNDIIFSLKAKLVLEEKPDATKEELKDLVNDENFIRNIFDKTGMGEPLIKLDPSGKSSIIKYDLPEETSYRGRNFIELAFPTTYFKQHARRGPTTNERAPVLDLSFEDASTIVNGGTIDGFTLATFVPTLANQPTRTTSNENDGDFVLATFDREALARDLSEGRKPIEYKYRTMYGNMKTGILREPTLVKPVIFIIEEYELHTVPGIFGAGKVVKSFSLFPGEKTQISLKTYRRTETIRKQTDTILDSFSEESADDFETKVQDEISDKKGYEQTMEYYAKVQAEASWGFGSASAEGGISGGTNATREQFAKNISASVRKHSSKASAKREVEVETSFEVKEEEGKETSIVREVENTNLSRTLNFVFRQINQEYTSILHLVDVRIGFFNGYAESAQEVSLSDIDVLLGKVLVNNKNIRKAVKEKIIGELQNIEDYKHKIHAFVEEKNLKGTNGRNLAKYWRVRNEITSDYTVENTAKKITVPGIILSVAKNVIKTEGMLAESILGEGPALDDYSLQLRDLELKRRNVELEHTALDSKKIELINKLVEQKDKERIELLSKFLNLTNFENKDLK